MTILRTIKCDVCGATDTEQEANSGWPGWGCINGVALNGAANPNLCAKCMFKVMKIVDKEASKHGMDES